MGHYSFSKHRQNDASYESGLTEGRLTALEDGVEEIETEIEKHNTRLTFQERIVYGAMGAIALIEFGPKILGFLSQ